MNLPAVAGKLVPIVYQDEHFVFVNKPAGLWYRDGDPVLRDWLTEIASSGPLLAVYDCPATQSGVVGFAKTLDAQRHLVTGISSGSVKSAYVAVVQGRVNRRGAVVAAAVKQVGRDRFVADRSRADRRTAGQDLPSTRIETVVRGESRALVRCRLNGVDDRQVRAHLQAAHLRIVGDVGPAAQPGKQQAVPLMLHLEEVRFHHPGLKRALSVRAPAPPAFQESLGLASRRGNLEGTLAYRLHAALAKRLPCFLDEETDALRLLHGRADGVTGLAADLYGEVLILQVLQGKFEAAEPRLRAIAQWYQRLLGLRAVYLKHFAKDRSRESDAAEGAGPLFDPQPLVGEPVEEQFAVREHGLKFLVRPYDGYSTGLFLEQRENRRRVRELAAGKRVLNLFAYTCGFSVAAAAGGAAPTVSVDASRRHLEWGKDNFRINGLSLDDQMFIHDDAFNYFKRAKRQERSFDLIIIDPPSFARLKKPRRAFTVTKDLRALLTEAITVLGPGGIMLVCTNHRELSRSWLREQVNLAAGERRVATLSTPELPLDFAGDPDYAKSIIVRVS